MAETDVGRLTGMRTTVAALGLVPLLGACAGMGGPPAPRPVAMVGRCADQRFPVYFAPGSDVVPPAALAVIRSASNRVSGCRIAAVDVLGVAHPDAPGGPLDTALTQRRADNVASALSAAGLPAPAFDVEIRGAVRLPPHGERAPLARKTEVVLHAQPAA